MAVPDLIGVGGPVGEPASHIRAALLATGLTLGAVHAIMLMTVYQPYNHQVSVELDDSAWAAQSGPDHRLEVAADEGIRLDGVPHRDLIELRIGLNRITLDRNAGLDLLVHPELRYETFLEILTVAKRAGVRRLRLSTELPGIHCGPESTCQ